LIAGKLTALDAPGGGEVQMLATARALRAIGVDARLWRPWEERLATADCLHLFGSLPEHLPLVEAARRQNIPVVLSTISWFSLRSYWREPRPIVGRMAACTRYLVRSACPRLPSWRRRLYHTVDMLLPNSQAEAWQLIRQFDVPAVKVHVGPNGAETRLATADPESFARLAGVRGFVLCPGRIEPRKNQLGVLRALKGTGLPVVILGQPVPGHEDYLAQCRRAADENVRFIGQLDHDDPLLASAYAACGCLVLASWFETPGLVALEAGMSGVPLVLPQEGSAAEYFGDFASYVHSTDYRAIRRAVLAAILRGRSAALAEHVAGNFSWQTAATATLEAYKRIVRGNERTA
jgi:glycosyltransferase involved in cell wall biosynthesis